MAIGGGVSNVGLGMTFSARDLASGPIRVIGGNFSQLHGSVRRGLPMMMAGFAGLAGSAAVLATGLAGLRGSFQLAEIAGGFEQSMARVGAVTTATVSTMDQLTQSAIRAGLATSFSPEQASEGLMVLSTAGFNANEAMTLITPALALAEGGMIGVGDAARATASATRVFSLGMEEASTVADDLLRITSLTQLQANELSHALGTVGRGAGATGQSLDEMLISMGLVRNTGLEATVAASSVSSALTFMARRADRFSEVGVAITDAQGRFRPFLDIVRETSEELGNRFPNEAERAAQATELFGRFGLSAYTAVSNQLVQGVRDASGEFVRGAEAVDYLRTTMANTEGTAAEFQRRVLDNFRGRMQLLTGTLQTLGTVLGMTFGTIFMPMIDAVRVSINAFIRAWRAIPEGIRTFIGVAILAISSFAVMGGGIGVVVFAVVLLVSVLGELLIVVGIVMAGIVAAMAPVFAAFGAVVAVGLVLRRAWERDLGSIRTFTETWGVRLRLLFEGLSSIFRTGRLSGGIFGELVANDEQNLLGFLRKIETFVGNARRVWEGFRAEFSDVLNSLTPTITDLQVAINGLGRQLGRTGGMFLDTANATSGDTYESFGQTLAQGVGGALQVIIEAATLTIEVLTDVLAIMADPGWQLFVSIIGNIAAAFQAISDVLSGISAIGHAVNPVQWITALVQKASGEEVTALPSFSEGRLVGGESALGIVSRGRREEARAEHEAALERPRGPRVSRGLNREELMAMLSAQGRGATSRELHARFGVNIDGREVAAAMRRFGLNESSMAGELVDEGPQSIPPGM